MNVELLNRLSECMELCHRLDRKMEEEEQHIGLCLGGEILSEYRKNAQTNRKQLSHIQQTLQYLQEIAQCGM